MNTEKFNTGTTQFKLAAIVYPKVLEILRTKTDAAHPLNVDEIIALIPEAKGAGQIYDAIRANKQHISAHREGKRKVFWWKANGGQKKQFELDYLKPLQVDNISNAFFFEKQHEDLHANLKRVKHQKINAELADLVRNRPSRNLPAEPTLEVPDIYIGKDKIIITTGKVKITVDL